MPVFLLLHKKSELQWLEVPMCKDTLISLIINLK